jgi:hypothetical protein
VGGVCAETDEVAAARNTKSATIGRVDFMRAGNATRMPESNA